MNKLNTTVKTNALVMVKLTIHFYGGSIMDDDGAEETATRNGADAKRVRLIKDLLPATSKSELGTIASQARSYFNAYTRPFEMGGWHVCKAAQVQAIADRVAKFDADYRAAADLMCSEENYQLLREQAKEGLAGLWDEKEFPDRMTLRSKYAIVLRRRPVFNMGMFDDMTGADPKTVADMKAQATAEQAECVRGVINSITDTLRKMVKDVADRIGKPDQKHLQYGRIQGTVKEVCNQLRTLNLTDDPDMTTMIEKVEATLTKPDPEALRTSRRVRGETKKEVEDLTAALADFGA